MDPPDGPWSDPGALRQTAGRSAGKQEKPEKYMVGAGLLRRGLTWCGAELGVREGELSTRGCLLGGYHPRVKPASGGQLFSPPWCPHT